MDKKQFLKSLLSFVFYILLVFIFIYFYISISGYEDVLKQLKTVFPDFSTNDTILFAAVLMSIISIIGFLIQYLISIFLTKVFLKNMKPRMYYALFPKIIILICNIIFVKFFLLNNEILYLISTLFSVLLIFIYSLYKQNDWKFSIVFITPFFVDAFVSFIRYFF